LPALCGASALRPWCLPSPKPRSTTSGPTPSKCLAEHDETHRRWSVAVKHHAFDSIRQRPLLNTTSDNLLKAMNAGIVSTNVYLRRSHNFALDMDWLL